MSLELCKVCLLFVPEKQKRFAQRQAEMKQIQQQQAQQREQDGGDLER